MEVIENLKKLISNFIENRQFAKNNNWCSFIGFPSQNSID